VAAVLVITQVQVLTEVLVVQVVARLVTALEVQLAGLELLVKVMRVVITLHPQIMAQAVAAVLVLLVGVELPQLAATAAQAQRIALQEAASHTAAVAAVALVQILLLLVQAVQVVAVLVVFQP
jgi:hypothetical protein